MDRPASTSGAEQTFIEQMPALVAVFDCQMRYVAVSQRFLSDMAYLFAAIFTPAEVIGLSAKVYQGAHLASPDVRVTSGTRVEAEPLYPWASVLLDVDGEQPGKLPVKATLIPSALTFRA